MKAMVKLSNKTPQAASCNVSAHTTLQGRRSQQETVSQSYLSPVLPRVSSQLQLHAIAVRGPTILNWMLQNRIKHKLRVSVLKNCYLWLPAVIYHLYKIKFFHLIIIPLCRQNLPARFNSFNVSDKHRTGTKTDLTRNSCWDFVINLKLRR